MDVLRQFTSAREWSFPSGIAEEFANHLRDLLRVHVHVSPFSMLCRGYL